jgi:hypothetical protein
MYFWIGIFFVSGSIFSFKDVHNTKILQSFIIFVRFITLLSMFFGAIFLIAKNGIQTLTPKDEGVFNINFFP